jgi:hypothetical protein
LANDARVIGNPHRLRTRSKIRANSVVGWVNDMFAGTHDGIYGAPQQSIQIDTSAGTATAVALPFTSTKTVRATPFDGLLSVVLDLAQNFFVYEPLAGRPGALTT